MIEPALGMVRSPQCGRLLGTLPCINTDLHQGDGKGCTHDAGDVPDRHDLADAAEAP